MDRARGNGLRNLSFVQADLYDPGGEHSWKGNRARLALLDPPGDGVGSPAIEALAQWEVERIAYIACGPKAMIKELKVLQVAGVRVRNLAFFGPVSPHRPLRVDGTSRARKLIWAFFKARSPACSRG